MAFYGPKLTTFILFTWIVGTTGKPSSIGDYLVDTINHLAAIDFGVPKIVFYGLSPQTSLSDQNLGGLIRDSRLEYVSRLIVTCSSNSAQTNHLPSKPTLIILQGDVTICINLLKSNLQAFSSGTKILIFAPRPEHQYYFVEILSELMFYNVVIIEGSINSSKIEIFPPPHKLFRGRYIPDRQGRSITVIQRPSYKCRHFRFVIVQQTAVITNSSTERVEHSCGNYESSCYERVMVENEVDFDCTLYSLRMLQGDFESLTAAMTSSEVILVPKCPYRVLQLLVMPFNWKLWTALLALLGCLEIIHTTCPALFQNDPLLFIVCGFEDYDLHNSTRREKLILLPMIVLMFFLTNAYSTILISLMISRPTIHPIRTLQDLVTSGVQIKSNPQNHRYLSHHPILGNSTVVSNESVYNMDKVHAHVVVRETAELILPMYYDHHHRMFRYGILDETLSMVIYMFRLSKRNPLLEAFRFVLDGLIESGIKNFLMERMSVNYNHLAVIGTEIDEILHFADVDMAWRVLLGGFSMAVAVFVLEQLWYRIKKSVKLYC